MGSFLYKHTDGDQIHLNGLHGHTLSSGAQDELDFLSSDLEADLYC